MNMATSGSLKSMSGCYQRLKACLFMNFCLRGCATSCCATSKLKGGRQCIIILLTKRLFLLTTLCENYSVIHTGDEWLPARDCFCSSPDVTHNDLPIGLIIFGDKSRTDLHGALALTPMIFTLTLLIELHGTMPNFGDL